MLGVVNRPIVRLVMVGLLLLTIQSTLLTEMRPFGVILDVLVGFAAAAGVVGGAERGALVGFVFGIMFDLALVTPFGLSALSYGLVGFLVGLAKTSVTVAHAWWLTMLFVVAGSALGVVIFVFTAALVGEPQQFDVRTAQVVAVIAVANGVLSPGMAPVCRWCLRIRREPV